MDGIKLHETDDAQIWAKEFIRIKNENNWSTSDIDESLMICWFANAIETAKDLQSCMTYSNC